CHTCLRYAIDFQLSFNEPDSEYCRASRIGDLICLFDTLRVAPFRPKVAQIIRSESAGRPYHRDAVAYLERIRLLTRCEAASGMLDINKAGHHTSAAFRVKPDSRLPSINRSQNRRQR